MGELARRFAFARAAPLAVAASLAAPAFAADHTVLMENMGYQPADLVVQSGERVVWVNKDLVPHTATAADGAFDSHAIDPGQSWAYTAATAGEHPYACTFHPTMTGKITIR